MYKSACGYNKTKLLNADQEVEYVYRYNQLTDIRYPENPRNNVRYRYGGPTDTLYNQVGRLVWQEDATGWQSYRYGKLGELTWNERTMIVPNNWHCYTFLMQYNYDVWNRIQSIVYPDGETVSYHYSVGGKLNSIGTRKGSDTTEYVRKIDYNERGLKLRMVYRNGVSTRYTYDSILRLSNMNDGTMQDITYTYDKVGNILRIDNNGNVVNSLGGGYVNEYRYDSLYRLVRADGAFDTLNHHLRMTYSPAGRILSKSLTARLMDENTGVPTNVNYAYGYTYNNAKPHTVREVRDSYSNDMHLLEWDANGNLQYYYFKSPEMERWHCWDEDNRLQATSDNHNTAFYQYGADGNRALKLSGESQQMSNNGNYHYFAQLNQVTLYPSPHIVVDGHGYTKHYYADNERICSRIGGGGIEGLYLPTDSVTARMLKYKPAENAMQAAQAGQCAMASVSVPSNTLGIMADMQTVQSAENDIYFVHSDHLGSASWVTNLSGQPIQHLQYLPYGESYIDQRSSTFHERYTFTGKEKDSESGYYYFGARYFMPNLSIWNSVDPMADKYPSLSPYNYCAWNPMKLVDPNGEEIVIKDGNNTYYYKNGSVYLKHGRVPVDRMLGKEASIIKNNLDKMLKHTSGKKVIKRLTMSKQLYTIAADGKTGEGNYSARRNKVTLVGGESNTLEALSHEIFHAYQDDYGRKPRTVYNEVEAYVFSSMISNKLAAGIKSTNNSEYNTHGLNLIKGFNSESFNYLVSHFRRDSSANFKGTYNGYGYNPGSYTLGQSLLKDL